MNKFFLITLIFCIISLKSNCQVAIGSASTGVDANVVLDLTNTSNRGLLLPFSSVIDSPEGNIFYNNNYKMISLIDNNGENLLSPWKYYSNSAAVTFGLEASVYIGVGIPSPSVKFHLKGSSDARGDISGGAFQIGLTTEQHIVMDSTRIISKYDENTESILKLQYANGHVEIGDHYTSNTDDSRNNLSGPVPSGGIIMWSGPSDSIPDGWVVCDGGPRGNGTNTPNLSGRFVVGIGSNGDNNYISGEKGGKDSIQLTVNEMPSHDHTGTTGIEGSHEHIYKDRFHIEHVSAIDNVNKHHSGWNYGLVTEDGGTWASNDKQGNAGGDTDNDGYLYTYDKTDSGNPSGLSSSKNFRDGTTLKSNEHSANHSHDIYPQGSGDWFTNRPKYYALCFIMKK